MLELGVASALMMILGFPASRPRLFAGLQHPFVLVGILDGLNVGLLEAGACGQRAYLTAQLISGLVTSISAYHHRRIFNSRAGACSYTKMRTVSPPALV